MSNLESIGEQTREFYRKQGEDRERIRITAWLKAHGIIRDGMFSPAFLVAYTSGDPIDIKADLGASEPEA